MDIIGEQEAYCIRYRILEKEEDLLRTRSARYHIDPTSILRARPSYRRSRNIQIPLGIEGGIGGGGRG